MHEVASFLYERISEDMKRLAHQIDSGQVVPADLVGTPLDVRRVAAENRAKKAILDDYVSELRVIAAGHTSEWTMGGQAAVERALRHLARPYCEHPEYRSEWHQ